MEGGSTLARNQSVYGTTLAVGGAAPAKGLRYHLKRKVRLPHDAQLFSLSKTEAERLLLADGSLCSGSFFYRLSPGQAGSIVLSLLVKQPREPPTVSHFALNLTGDAKGGDTMQQLRTFTKMFSRSQHPLLPIRLAHFVDRRPGYGRFRRSCRVRESKGVAIVQREDAENEALESEEDEEDEEDVDIKTSTQPTPASISISPVPIDDDNEPLYDNYERPVSSPPPESDAHPQPRKATGRKHSGGYDEPQDTVPIPLVPTPGTPRFTCAECGNSTVAGNVDEWDGFFYCDPCWIAFEAEEANSDEENNKAAVLEEITELTIAEEGEVADQGKSQSGSSVLAEEEPAYDAVLPSASPTITYDPSIAPYSDTLTTSGNDTPAYAVSTKQTGRVSSPSAAHPLEQDVGCHDGDGYEYLSDEENAVDKGTASDGYEDMDGTNEPENDMYTTKPQEKTSRPSHGWMKAFRDRVLSTGSRASASSTEDALCNPSSSVKISDSSSRGGITLANWGSSEESKTETIKPKKRTLKQKLFSRGSPRDRKSVV